MLFKKVAISSCLFHSAPYQNILLPWLWACKTRSSNSIYCRRFTSYGLRYSTNSLIWRVTTRPSKYTEFYGLLSGLNAKPNYCQKTNIAEGQLGYSNSEKLDNVNLTDSKYGSICLPQETHHFTFKLCVQGIKTAITRLLYVKMSQNNSNNMAVFALNSGSYVLWHKFYPTLFVAINICNLNYSNTCML